MKSLIQDPQKIEQIFNSVYKKALNFLSYKERTSNELSLALDKYISKFSLQDKEKEKLKKEVLDELGPAFVVDDNTYVKDYIFEIIRMKRFSSKKQISAFLIKKGVHKEAIVKGLDKYYTDEIEKGIISDLCNKKIKTDNLQEKSKVVRYLVSRGFSPWLVYTVVDTKFKR